MLQHARKLHELLQAERALKELLLKELQRKEWEVLDLKMQVRDMAAQLAEPATRPDNNIVKALRLCRRSDFRN